jgi:hypothetical protein
MLFNDAVCTAEMKNMKTEGKIENTAWKGRGLFPGIHLQGLRITGSTAENQNAQVYHLNTTHARFPFVKLNKKKLLTRNEIFTKTNFLIPVYMFSNCVLI